MVEAFSSSLDVCGVNPAVARASRLLRFAGSVSVHTRTHLDWVFVTSSLRETSPACALLGKKKKKSDEEAVFVHAFTRVATVSHALCSEIETGI